MSKLDRKKLLLMFSGLLAVLCSCNSVKYIAINNNEYPRRVIVTYKHDAEIYWNGDSLNAGLTGETEFDTILTRKDIDSVTYTFMAPANKHIELMPKGKGEVITSIVIQPANPAETPLKINLTDKEELKRLSKEGIIQWYGPYSDLIIINKGNPPEPAPEEETEAAAE
ncbi:MAG: hypothetical protein EOP49_35365 [Sphingobacteriales bacterium]|nr:MAG: hypothetical protein EOP49_35365 [Sphingobacteriales bacterium]